MSLTARVAPLPHPVAQALHAEWTKLRTVVGPAWLLAGVVALTVTVGAAVSSVAGCSSAACGTDPAQVSFTGIYPAQALVAVAGVLAVGNEYSTGMIKLSLTAMPRRLTWFFAKTAVLTAPALTASALMSHQSQRKSHFPSKWPSWRRAPTATRRARTRLTLGRSSRAQR